jgi:hypothetical protein
VWLTLVTLLTVAILLVVSPSGATVNPVYSRSCVEFRQSLLPAEQRSPTPVISSGDCRAPTAERSPSLATLNQFRAALVADMLFLLAYGLLLRESILYAGRQRLASLARGVAILTMAADATENLSALAVVGQVTAGGAGPPGWVYLLMNTASIVKWLSLGMVMLYLAVRWRALLGTLEGRNRIAGRVVLAACAAGGLGAVASAASFWVPAIRQGASSLAVFGLSVAFLVQFSLVNLIGVSLRLVYLARAPLLVLLIMAGFGPLSLGPASRLFGAILDVANRTGIATATTAALVVAFSCATQINLIRAYAWRRTFDRTLLVLRHRTLKRAISWTALVAAMSLLFSIALVSTQWSAPPGTVAVAVHLSLVSVLAAMGMGVLLALVFLFVFEWISLRWSRQRPGHPLPQLAVPFDRMPVIGDWLRQADATSAPPALVGGKTEVPRFSLAAKLFGLDSGYIEQLPDGTRRLRPGHTFALIQLALSMLLYAGLIFGKWFFVTRDETDLWVTSAGAIALLLLVNSWGLAGLTFFFDRYRVPLFTVVVALGLLTGLSPRSDYQARPSPSPTTGTHYQLATPGEVLAAFPDPLVFAGAGGGIQAGAWTARVLQGITEALRDNHKADLRSRTALVSGVSGGSMGALYYGAYQDIDVRQATAKSLQPSLDEVASAFIGADHLRRLSGWPVGRDRGRALEHSWASRLPDEGRHATLREWSDRVRDFAAQPFSSTRPFPAFLFNTTIVETGQPMAFVTTQFPTKRYRRSLQSDSREYPVTESAARVFRLSADGESVRDAGLEMATAARLSAAFPYVSPAATLRLDETTPQLHMVDGGYYDNYGLASLTQWLDDALEQQWDTGWTKPRTMTVSVVLIRGLTENVDENMEQLRRAETSQSLSTATINTPGKGWLWQVLAPPLALLQTRSFGQWAGGMQTLRLLTEKWRGRVTITRYLVDFPAERLPLVCRASPLSWKLTPPQQHCIEMAWPIAAREQVSALWK